jgi:hypothetical protein
MRLNFGVRLASIFVAMNVFEARALLAEQLAHLRRQPYSELRRRLNSPEPIEARGATGVRYFVEIQAFFDDPPRENLRVLASIDDGGGRALVPISDAFILTPEGLFVGE